MSNEVKIGILAIVAIALSFWGYKFILGKNVLVKSNIFKVYYHNVEGLKVGTPVRINGVEIGGVASVQLVPEAEKQVLVILDLDKNIKIPEDATAAIISTGFMGGKAVNLEFDTPCSGAACAKSGDILQGEVKGLLASMMGEDNIESYLDILKEGLSDMLDTLNKALLSEDSESPIAEALGDLRITMANLKSTSGRLDNLMSRASGDIEGTLADLKALSGTLEGQKESIGNILSNADSISQSLVEADIQQTLSEMDSTLKDLQATLRTAGEALNGVSSMMNTINAGEGSLGKIINDEELYKSLVALSIKLDSLFTDFQEKPYRYMPLKGHRKVQKYDRKDARLEEEN